MPPMLLTGTALAVDSEAPGAACYLTTAARQLVGWPESGHERLVLGWFCDEIVRRRPGGAYLVADHTARAPRVVQAIQEAPDRDAILASLLRTIRGIVAQVEAGDYDSAVVTWVVEWDRLEEALGLAPVTSVR